MNQGEFFSFVIDVLEELDIPYMITGSVAAMAYGEPRLTLDMDVVVDLSENKAEEFCRKFGGDFYSIKAHGLARGPDAVLARGRGQGHATGKWRPVPMGTIPASSRHFPR